MGRAHRFESPRNGKEVRVVVKGGESGLRGLSRTGIRDLRADQVVVEREATDNVHPTRIRIPVSTLTEIPFGTLESASEPILRRTVRIRGFPYCHRQVPMAKERIDGVERSVRNRRFKPIRRCSRGIRPCHSSEPDPCTDVQMAFDVSSAQRKKRRGLRLNLFLSDAEIPVSAKRPKRQHV